MAHHTCILENMIKIDHFIFNFEIKKKFIPTSNSAESLPFWNSRLTQKLKLKFVKSLDITHRLWI